MTDCYFQQWIKGGRIERTKRETCSVSYTDLINHSQTQKALLTGFSDFIAKSLCPVEQGWLQTYPNIFLSSGSCVMKDILLIGCSCCAFCNRKLKTWIETHSFLQQVLTLGQKKRD